ncbi:MAG: UDP-N-acetylmuramoyl-L-alanyl-D-glutamate--2,6-diaminopimelate ligase [Bacteroidales bacterium]
MGKSLRDILNRMDLAEVRGDTKKMVSGIAFDSRKVSRNCLFAAVRGLTTDGHLFIDKAIEAGATAVICESIPASTADRVTYVRVKDSATALGVAASNFYGEPGKKIKLIGITGTNGKTTIANLLFNLFQTMGYPSGLISTVGNMVGTRKSDASHTTPDPVILNGLLHEMVADGCQYAFMEVSSHAIVQKRIEGVHFSGGVFTNLTRDHLDYHKTFRDYLQAKKVFFDGLHKGAFALTNIDDKNGRVMLQNSSATKKTYSLRSMADFNAKILESSFQGTHLLIDGREVWCKLVGAFNVYNLLAAYGVAALLDVPPEEALQALSKISPAEGRFDHFPLPSGATAIVDYAHTPDAIENVLKTIQELRGGNEQLITVIGCGGDRDAGKRPVMTAIAASYSDRLILTSDNPRTEEPEKIVEDMKAGLDAQTRSKALSILNRKEAIHAACAIAGKNDIILVAGKGHEKYQEINGIRHPFDDKLIIKEAFS